MGDKRFEDEDGAGVQRWQRGADCTVELCMLEEGVTVLRQGGAAPTVRAAKNSEFGEGKL